MLRVIKNEEQYEDALERVYDMMQQDIDEDSETADELTILSMLIKKYEEENYHVPNPSPLDAIRFKVEQMNISDAEFSKILGARSRKSEILSGKRKLSLSMIRNLNVKLKISADILIQLY